MKGFKVVSDKVPQIEVFIRWNEDEKPPSVEEASQALVNMTAKIMTELHKRGAED